MKILIIEDDDLVAGAYKRAAKFRGHEAVVASNGKEALEQLKELNKFNAILSDLMLPGMNGIEIYEKAPKQLKKRFVFNTGTMAGPLREKLDKLGVTVLTKPASNDDIFNALEKAAQLKE